MQISRYYTIILLFTFTTLLSIQGKNYPFIGDSKNAKSIKTIKLNKTSKWQEHNSKFLRSLKAQKSKLKLSDKYIFDGNYSLEWKHKRGSSITIPINAAKKRTMQLFLAFYNEPAGKKNFKAEFLDDSNRRVMSFKINTNRQFWNHCQARFSNYSPASVLNLSDINGKFSDKIRKFRIYAPTNGITYIGKISLVLNYKTGAGKKSKDLRMDSPGSSKKFSKIKRPRLNKANPNEIAGLKTVAARLDKEFGIGDTSQKLSNKEYQDIQKYFATLKIKRTRYGMNGKNVTIIPNKSSWESEERDYSVFMNRVANAYHKTTGKKHNELGKMFLLLYDYQWYLGGMPDYWSGSGEKYVDSLFKMRKLLNQNKRLTGKVIENMKKRLSFDRIYLKYSYYCRSWGSRKYSKDELGEDTDYLRMRARDFPMIILLDPDINRQNRDLHAYSNWLSNIVMHCSPGVIDGFKPDGTVNHHWGWLNHYGQGVFNTCAPLFWYLGRTPFRISTRAHNFFKKMMLKHDFYCKDSIHPPILSGKSFSPKSYGGPGSDISGRFAYMSMAGTPDGKNPIDKEMLAIQLRRIKNYEKIAKRKPNLNHYIMQQCKKLAKQYNIPPTLSPSGHLTLGWGAAAIHRRNNWMLAVKGHSKYQYEAESFNFSTFLGYGTIYPFYERWNRHGHPKLEYEFGMDGWDWRKMPGTTAILWPFEKVVKKDYKRYYQRKGFVGGTTFNNNGVFAIDIQGSKKQGLDSFLAQKSYFFFDNIVVCLTEVSNNIKDAETITSVFQNAIGPNKTDTILNGKKIKQFPWKKLDNNSQGSWILDTRGTGYYIPADQKFSLTREQQNSPDAGNRKQTKGNYATCIITNGKAPKRARCIYFLLPASTPNDLKNFSASMQSNSPKFKTIQFNSYANIIRDNDKNTTGGVIWKKSNKLKDPLVIKSAAPCTYMYKLQNNQLEIGIADPELHLKRYGQKGIGINSWGYSQPSKITLTLKGKWKLATRKTKAKIQIKNNSTTLSVICRSGLTTKFKLMKTK